MTEDHVDMQSEISAAAARVSGLVRQTPVLEAELSWFQPTVEMKLEHLQHTGSFKPRGAFNSLLSMDVPSAGVVAASGGNHGAAVAYAASVLGYRSRIFVPEIAGPAKIDLIRRAGADLQVVPGAYADALAAAQAFEAETGAAQIHAYDAPGTVFGQGTVLREWEEQGLAADTVLIAVGGGGLIGGALGWLAGRRRVVAVEPETCAALNRALAAGHPVDVEVSGIAANSLGARKIGEICFGLAQSTETVSVTVSDADIAHAQTVLWQDLRQIVEPGGAAALAALLSGAYKPTPDERVAVLICGANPAPDPIG